MSHSLYKHYIHCTITHTYFTMYMIMNATMYNLSRLRPRRSFTAWHGSQKSYPKTTT